MPAGSRSGGGAAQGGEQRVAAAAVDRAHPAQVAVELAAGEEVGEGQLVDHGRAAVGEQLGLGDRRRRGAAAGRASRAAAPAPASCWPCRRRATWSGARPCMAPIGCAVVAVLGVVVVLDDERVARSRPAQDGGAALGRAARAPVGHWCDGVRTSASASAPSAPRRGSPSRRPARRRPPGRRRGRAAGRRRRPTGPRRRAASRPRAASTSMSSPMPWRVAVADHDVRPAWPTCRGPG